MGTSAPPTATCRHDFLHHRRIDATRHAARPRRGAGANRWSPCLRLQLPFLTAVLWLFGGARDRLAKPPHFARLCALPACAARGRLSSKAVRTGAPRAPSTTNVAARTGRVRGGPRPVERRGPELDAPPRGISVQQRRRRRWRRVRVRALPGAAWRALDCFAPRAAGAHSSGCGGRCAVWQAPASMDDGRGVRRAGTAGGGTASNTARRTYAPRRRNGGVGCGVFGTHRRGRSAQAVAAVR